MIFWALVAGALIGWSTTYNGEFGMIAGGVVGALMGKWLRSILRGEIRAALAQLVSLPAFRAMPESEFEPMREPEPRPIREPAPEPEFLPQAVIEPAAPRASAQRATTSEQIQTSAGNFLKGSPLGKLVEFAMGGNTIVRAGLVLLFIGLAFLARLVVKAGLFPIELRLATIGAAGIALLVVGFQKRIERRDFGLQLQGAGVAVLYLTVFAAARLYGVMPPFAAFGFMVVFAGLGAWLAVKQDSLAMAMASFLGGFAVPLLLGGHAETPTGLFTYITVLNLAILWTARTTSWRPLNLLGFGATFLMAAAWGFGSYSDSQFAVCELFLALSIAIYLATALLYAHNTPGKLGNFADSTLLFGTAITGFGLQAGLVHDRPFAAAWSAVVFGAVYLALASWAFRRRHAGMGLLSESLLAIGVGFVTLTIPLALDVKWTSAAWALEGAGAFWVGARQARWMPRAFGLALQALGGLIVLMTLRTNVSALPLLNDGFIGPMLVVAPLVFTAWQLRRDLPHSGSRWALGWQPVERGLEKPLFLAGIAFAGLAAVQEATRHLPIAAPEGYSTPVLADYQTAFAILCDGLGLMLLADWFGRRTGWTVASWPARLSLPLIGLTFLMTAAMGRYVVYLPDLVIWLGAFAVHCWLLRRADLAPESAAARWNDAVHTAGVLLLTAMLADALFFGIERGELWDTSWAGVVYLAAGIAVLLGLTRWAGRAAPLGAAAGLGWPLAPHAKAYWWRAATVLAVLVYAGALIGTMFADGITAPLPYIPLLNPVDLAVALALVALGLWRQMVRTAKPLPLGSAALLGPEALAAGALLTFVWINTVWIRTARHYLRVDAAGPELLQNQVVLTGFSILWTLLAMGLMFLARQRAERLPWLAGAVLLGVVVAKLLFVDMGRADGFARVVAFIAVGVLMLLIGYFVPLPPKRAEEPA